MSFIYLIFVVLLTTGMTISTNSSFNRAILIASCRSNDNQGSESIAIPSTRHYFFHFSTQSSSSSSFSSFSSSSPSSSSSSSPSSWHLSYCEHPQTTYYSSSGFAILRSSPQFLSAAVAFGQHPSTFHHYNAVVDQSSTGGPITLMSLPTNENSAIGENAASDYGNSDLLLSTRSTTIIPKSTPNFAFNSLSSSPATTSSLANISILHSSWPTQRNIRTPNIGLVIGCVSGGIVILIILIYAIVKYRNRDEGSYKIDESKNFGAASYFDSSHSGDGTSNKTGSSGHHHHHHHQKLLSTDERTNGGQAREWYV